MAKLTASGPNTRIECIRTLLRLRLRVCERQGPVGTADGDNHEHCRPGNRHSPRHPRRHLRSKTARLGDLRCFLAGRANHRRLDHHEQPRAGALAVDSSSQYRTGAYQDKGIKDAPSSRCRRHSNRKKILSPSVCCVLTSASTHKRIAGASNDTTSPDRLPARRRQHAAR